jgi:hypothetical protein
LWHRHCRQQNKQAHPGLFWGWTSRIAFSRRLGARARGLSNIEFCMGDMLNLSLSGAQFDAVICVF